MQAMGGTSTSMRNPIKGGFTTEHAAAVIVIGSLVALIMINRGFRGISVMGASVKVG